MYVQGRIGLKMGFLVLFLLAACTPQSGRDVYTTPRVPSGATTSQTAIPIMEATKPEQTATSVLPSSPAVPPTQANVSSPSSTQKTPIEAKAGIHILNLASDNELLLFNEANAYWTRFDGIRWNEIEPVRTEPPTYLWDKVDENNLRRATESGAHVVGLIMYAPLWAQKYPDLACGPISESALDQYGQFVNALVARYSKPPYNVLYWEIGNEPDVDRNTVSGDSGFGCWGEPDQPYFGGEYYGEMLEKVYPQIKAANPDAQVMVGGQLLDCDPINPPEQSSNPGTVKDCSPSRFIEGILRKAGDHFDGISFHAYDYYMGSLGKFSNTNWHSDSSSTGPVLIAKANYLRALLASYGYSNKMLMNTEVALLCGSTGTEEPCLKEDFELTKAYYVAEAYASALADGLKANIWYNLNGWRGSGLVDANLTPNRAYNAFRFSSEQLAGATFTQELKDFAGVRGYEFTQNGNRLWVVWSLDGEQHQIQLPGNPSEVFDTFGNQQTIAEAGTVTIAPSYLVWTK